MVDESFTEFSAAGASASVEDALDSRPTLAVVKSMSKVFGIAGLRLGYLRSGDPAFVAAAQGALPIWNVNGLAEEFLRAVGRYHREFEQSCRLTRSAYLDLYADVDELAGLVPIAPDANFVMCWLEDGFTRWPVGRPAPVRGTQHPDQGLRRQEHARGIAISTPGLAHAGGEPPTGGGAAIGAGGLGRRIMSETPGGPPRRHAAEPDGSDPAALMRHLERTIPPMDLGDAERLLREAKSIFDAHEITFFLRQGTCLGAVRDGALIPWDDDLDLGSIIGRHGLTADRIEPVAAAFRANDCHVEVAHEGLYTSVRIFKYRIRIDWQCYRVLQGTIAHYPGVPFPARLFDDLSELPFLGETYLVPSPVEEYLELKYGADWVTPKQAGYEKDVLDAMPEGTVPGRAGRLRRFLSVRLRPRTAARLVVLDVAGQPVPGARGAGGRLGREPGGPSRCGALLSAGRG